MNNCRKTNKTVIVIIAILILLSGCDGSALTDRITVKALYGVTLLELPITCREDAYYKMSKSGAIFRTSKSFSEIRSIAERYAEANSGYTTAFDPAQILITFKLKDEKQDYFLLSQVGHNQFSISTMCSSVYFEGSDTTGDGNNLLLPLFLFNDKRLESSQLFPHLYEGVQYELMPDVDVEDFWDFYRNSGWFDTKTQNGTLILKSSITVTEHPDKQQFQVPYPLVFRIETHVNKSYIVIEKGK